MGQMIDFGEKQDHQVVMDALALMQIEIGASTGELGGLPVIPVRILTGAQNNFLKLKIRMLDSFLPCTSNRLSSTTMFIHIVNLSCFLGVGHWMSRRISTTCTTWQILEMMPSTQSTKKHLRLDASHACSMLQVEAPWIMFLVCLVFLTAM